MSKDSLKNGKEKKTNAENSETLTPKFSLASLMKEKPNLDKKRKYINMIRSPAANRQNVSQLNSSGDEMDIEDEEFGLSQPNDITEKLHEEIQNQKMSKQFTNFNWNKIPLSNVNHISLLSSAFQVNKSSRELLNNYEYNTLGHLLPIAPFYQKKTKFSLSSFISALEERDWFSFQLLETNTNAETDKHSQFKIFLEICLKDWIKEAESEKDFAFLILLSFEMKWQWKWQLLEHWHRKDDFQKSDLLYKSLSYILNQQQNNQEYVYNLLTQVFSFFSDFAHFYILKQKYFPLSHVFSRLFDEHFMEKCIKNYHSWPETEIALLKFLSSSKMSIHSQTDFHYIKCVLKCLYNLLDMHVTLEQPIEEKWLKTFNYMNSRIIDRQLKDDQRMIVKDLLFCLEAKCIRINQWLNRTKEKKQKTIESFVKK